MSHAFHSQPEGGPAAQTLTPQPTQDDPLPLDVCEHVQRLRLILPVISVSVMALHRQNAELDTDIASVLSHYACKPLDRESARLASISALRAWLRRQQEVHV